MNSPAFFSALSVVCTFFGFVPYIVTTVKGKTVPHVFSWVVWSLTTGVVFLAVLSEGAGKGGWSLGVSACTTVLIAALAYMKKGDVRIHRSDWVFLFLAVAALPLWYFTSDPLWAVVILTAVDMFGFVPTVRKAYEMPHTESLGFYTAFALSHFFALLALENRTLTTMLFSVALCAACGVTMCIIVARRRSVKAA